MGLSVHDPFVDPLGNPLGLARNKSEGSAEAFIGPSLQIITTPGSGSRVLPKGANYRITIVGAGAAGAILLGGGSGAVAIKTGVVDKDSFRIAWLIGKGGDIDNPDGEATTLDGPPGLSMVAGGGDVTKGVAPSAIGGDINYIGAARKISAGIVTQLNVPGAGGFIARTGTYTGGGAGYAGGSGGRGGPVDSGGDNSVAPQGGAELGLGITDPTLTAAFSGQRGEPNTKGGDGGPGGGGGGASSNNAPMAGNGGVGMVRIELW